MVSAPPWIGRGTGIGLLDPQVLGWEVPERVLAVVNPGASGNFTTDAEAAWEESLRDESMTAALAVTPRSQFWHLDDLPSWLGWPRPVGIRLLVAGTASATERNIRHALPSAGSPARIDQTSDGAVLAVIGDHLPAETALTRVFAKCGLWGSWGVPRVVAAEYYLDPGNRLDGPRVQPSGGAPVHVPRGRSILGQVWRDVVKHPVIPYDPAERRHTLAHAYDELDYYVRKWEARAGEDW